VFISTSNYILGVQAKAKEVEGQATKSCSYPFLYCVSLSLGECVYWCECRNLQEQQRQ